MCVFKQNRIFLFKGLNEKGAGFISINKRTYHFLNIPGCLLRQSLNNHYQIWPLQLSKIQLHRRTRGAVKYIRALLHNLTDDG